MIAYYVISIFVALATVIYCYLRSVYSYWKKRSVIGPETIPFFGNIMDSALRLKHSAVLFKKIYNDFPNEKFVGFYKMTSPALLIRDLDIVKQILIKDFEAFPDRGIGFSKEGLGDNLFHCDPTTWKALRWHMSPLFTPAKLKNIMHVLEDQSDKFVDHLESVCLKQSEQEVMQLFKKYTIASIMACSFGISVDTINDNSEIFDKIDYSLFNISYVNEINMVFPGILKKMNSSLFNETVNKFCHEVVEAVKLQRNVTPTVMNNVIDILLALKKQGEVKSLKKLENEKEVSLKLTDHVMAGQVFVFYAAGYGNNTNVLSCAMYQLAKNPEIQNKLIVEIDEVLERFNGNVTYESVKEMAYLEQVFYETLRMHPTTNSIQRVAARDYIVPGTNLKIDKGVSVLISPLAIHYDEKVYTNPGKFHPERFAPDIVKERHLCAYLPFGAGARSCLGMRFAVVQFKVCVLKLLSKFRVEPSRRTKGDYVINPYRSLLSPEGGIYLKFVPRSSKTEINEANSS